MPELQHDFSAPEEQQLIDLLRTIPAEPTPHFYSRMAGAPWVAPQPLPALIKRRNLAGRRLGMGVAALAVLAALWMQPVVRAFAGQMLQGFRVQHVVFVPTNPDQLQQLAKSGIDPKSLFASQPKLINKPGQPRVVDPTGAAAAVGFTPQQVTRLPSQSATTEYRVIDTVKAQFQVNVATVRQILQVLNITDVQIPDALGADPIIVEAPTSLETHYSGTNYQLVLNQGHSPAASLPPGVDLAQLGTAALRVAGMDHDAAAALSKQIDWNTTLVFPFPANMRNVTQVTIGQAQGLLVAGSGATIPDGKATAATGTNEQEVAVYWQNGDRFYVLRGSGAINDAQLLAAARSVK